MLDLGAAPGRRRRLGLPALRPAVPRAPRPAPPAHRRRPSRPRPVRTPITLPSPLTARRLIWTDPSALWAVQTRLYTLLPPLSLSLVRPSRLSRPLSCRARACVDRRELAEDFDTSSAVACPLPRPAGGATFHLNRTLHFSRPNTTDVPRRAYVMSAGFPTTPRAPAPHAAAREPHQHKLILAVRWCVGRVGGGEAAVAAGGECLGLRGGAAEAGGDQDPLPARRRAPLSARRVRNDKPAVFEMHREHLGSSCSSPRCPLRC